MWRKISVVFLLSFVLWACFHAQGSYVDAYWMGTNSYAVESVEVEKDLNNSLANCGSFEQEICSMDQVDSYDISKGLGNTLFEETNSEEHKGKAALNLLYLLLFILVVVPVAVILVVVVVYYVGVRTIILAYSNKIEGNTKKDAVILTLYFVFALIVGTLVMVCIFPFTKVSIEDFCIRAFTYVVFFLLAAHNTFLMIKHRKYLKSIGIALGLILFGSSFTDYTFLMIFDIYMAFYIFISFLFYKPRKWEDADEIED